MPFFDFNLITDPPGDALVNLTTHLNDNFDKLDTRLNQFQQLPTNTVISPPVGTEALRSSIIQVWDGSAWRFADNPNSNWGAWITLPLLAPVVERPSFTPKYRINTLIRKVELAGGLRAEVTAGPWARSKVQISANAGGIPDANKPVLSPTIQQGAAGVSTTAGQFAGARIHIEGNAGNSVKISVSYQGDDIGGNFVMLDAINWWY